MDRFIDTLIEHEGKSKSAYQDSLGFWTIGIGTLIDAKKDAGLTDSEMIYLLNNRLMIAEKELSHFPWFINLDIVRQDMLIELCFNIGLQGLLKFHQMIFAIQNKDFGAAAMHLLNSKWAKQVKINRADNMARRLKTGSYD